MADVSPRDSAFVFARRSHGRGAQFRAHAWRIWSGADGRRRPCRGDAHRFHRHLRPRRDARIWRSQPAGVASPGHRVWRALSGVRRESPRVDPGVDTMDREVNSLRLVACIQKKRREDASFILDVSLDAPPGITILFGPSGAGKSTLLDCLSGLLRPDAGKIAVCEKVLFDSALGIDVPPQKRRIAYVFQSLARSEEHTSELQSRLHLVCRLLLEKKKKEYMSMSVLHYLHPHAL